MNETEVLVIGRENYICQI